MYFVAIFFSILDFKVFLKLYGEGKKKLYQENLETKKMKKNATDSIAMKSKSYIKKKLREE